MPRRKQKALTVLEIKKKKLPGKYTDGNGLTLVVEKSEAKRWIQRVTIKGRQRNVGLGGFPAVTLAAARDMAESNLRAIGSGLDIIEEKRRAKVAAKAPVPIMPTFAEEAAAYIDFRRPTWSNEKHIAQWESTLATYAGPVLGEIPVDEITTAHIMDVLTPIWTEKHETASRVRQRMESVFDWAMNKGHRSDNPAEKRLLKSLPQMRKRKKRHRALHCSQVPAALEKVRESASDPATKMAFQFLVLTASRSGETRGACWDEINWDTATWTIPAERMKPRRIHQVPLSQASIDILHQARALNGEVEEGLIFPSTRRGKILSDMTFTEMLRRLEIPAVPLGFRRSFKTWTLETKVATREESEAALSQNIGEDDSEEAYIDTELLQSRRPVMEQWAEFLRPTGRD